MTAIGIYLLISLFFVVGAMVEFAVLLFLLRRSEKSSYLKEKGGLSSSKSNSKHPIECKEIKRIASTIHRQESSTRYFDDSFKDNLNDFFTYSSTIDLAAAAIFPLAYIIFNIVYWLHYLT